MSAAARVPALLLALPLALAACTAAGRADPAHSLHVANETTVAVAVVVNGLELDVLEPGDEPFAATVAALPFAPWDVQARARSGRVLASLIVPTLEGVTFRQGYATRADLACGRLDIWVGPPLAGPAFSPDPARPCD
jgi:hypothetical protein